MTFAQLNVATIWYNRVNPTIALWGSHYTRNRN